MSWHPPMPENEISMMLDGLHLCTLTVIGGRTMLWNSLFEHWTFVHNLWNKRQQSEEIWDGRNLGVWRVICRPKLVTSYNAYFCNPKKQFRTIFHDLWFYLNYTFCLKDTFVTWKIWLCFDIKFLVYSPIPDCCESL
jgi:hypothetical protein